MPAHHRHPPRQRAGGSAQKMADQMRSAEIRAQHRRARWIVPPVAAAAGALGWYAAAFLRSPLAGAVVALVPVLAVLGRLYRSEGSNWKKGAIGERRTGRILAPLQYASFGRWAVLHDRRIPNSRANLDHLVLHSRSGATYVDSKAWAAKGARVRLDRDGDLWYGRYPQRGTLETVRWEAGRASAALGVPVRPVVAVHHAHVPAGGLHSAGVDIIAAPELRRYLRRLPRQAGWSRGRVRTVRALAEAALPVYDA